MDNDLDAMEDATQPLIERLLTSFMREMIEQYEADDMVGLPTNARERTEEMLRDTYDASMRMGGKPMIDGLKDCFPHIETKQDEDDLFQRLINEYIERFGATKVLQILETTRKQVMGVIREGQREGLGVEEIARLLREAVPEFSRIRSRVIARTETHGSSQYAQFRTAQQSTRPLVKQWNSTEDGRTRTIIMDDRYDHRVIDEQRVALEQPFMVPTIFGTKEPLMYPGDPAGTAGNIINCRCAMTFRRADRDEQITPNITTVRKPLPSNRALLLSSIADQQPVFASNNDKSFNSAPILALNAIRRSKDLGAMIKGKKGAYATFGNRISMGRHKMGTGAYKNVFRHEYGHILDDQMAKANPNRTGNRKMFQSWDAIDDLADDTRTLEMSRSGLFSGDKNPSTRLNNRVRDNEMLHSEARIRIRRKARENNTWDDPKAILRDNIPDAKPEDVLKLFGVIDDEINRSTAIEIAAAWERRDVYRLLQQVPSDLNYNMSHSGSLAGLQDTFEAGTAGKIRISFGHGESYYKRNNRFMQNRDMVKTINRRKYNGFTTAQAFANWLDAYGSPNPAAYQLYRNLWPKTAARFEGIVNAYVGMAS